MSPFCEDVWIWLSLRLCDYWFCKGFTLYFVYTKGYYQKYSELLIPPFKVNVLSYALVFWLQKMCIVEPIKYTKSKRKNDSCFYI